MLTEEMKNRLIEKLAPLVRDASKLGCFGGGFNGVDSWCQCAGTDQVKHWKNQKRKADLQLQMLKIIKDETGKEAFIFPGTYSDYHFCDLSTLKSWETGATEIIALKPDGSELKEPRSYA